MTHQAHHQADEDAPLILLQSPYLRAIDRRTGRQRWVVVIEHADANVVFPGRLFPTGERDIFVVTSDRILHVDPHDGRVKDTHDLPFIPDAVLYDGEAFFVSNLESTAAIGLDGKVRWSTMIEQGRAGHLRVCRDAQGRVLWQEDHLSIQLSTAAAGLAIGMNVAQPDAKGRF